MKRDKIMEGERRPRLGPKSVWEFSIGSIVAFQSVGKERLVI